MIACLLLSRSFTGVCSLYRGFKFAQNLTLMTTTGVGVGWGEGGLVFIFNLACLLSNLHKITQPWWRNITS